MKKTKLLAIISALLCLCLLLSSCGAGNTANQDDPITAEAILKNFITLDKAVDTPVLTKAQHLSETYGNIVETYGPYYLFCKTEKDFLNNLTETYTVYSFATNSAILTLKNSYVDEYNGEDEYGHKLCPPVTLSVSFMNECIRAVYTEATPIATDVLERDFLGQDELSESYSFATRLEFYDIKGTLITSYYADKNSASARPQVMMSNDYQALVRFGKTVALFKNTGEFIEAYNGDVELSSPLYNYSNDKYNYVLSTPLNTLEVYDKNGAPVLVYEYGDVGMNMGSFVIDNGDVLLQYLFVTEGDDFDAFTEEMKFDVKQFLLDVETGKVTPVDLGYYVSQLVSAKDFNEMMETWELQVGDSLGFSLTENARNIIIGSTYDCLASMFGPGSGSAPETFTIFADNLLNVNYVLDGRLTFEHSKADDVDVYEAYAPRALNGGYFLVQLASGVADRAIIDADGKVVAYVPEGALVLENYIFINETFYNFKMEALDEVSLPFLDGNNSSYEYTYRLVGTLGDTVVYSVNTHTIGDPDDLTDDKYQDKMYFVTLSEQYIYNDKDVEELDFYTNVSTRTDCVIATTKSGTECIFDGAIIIKDDSGKYSVYNVNDSCIFTFTLDNINLTGTAFKANYVNDNLIITYGNNGNTDTIVFSAAANENY